METKKISIRDAFNYAWQTFKNNWQLFLILAIINAAISGLQNGIDWKNKEIANYAWVFFLLLTILSIIVNIGILKITLRVYDKEQPNVGEVFNYNKYFWRYIGAGILYGLLVVAGLILFVVPGIYWALKYSMTPNLIVDKDCKILDAFHKSCELTYGVKWRLILFGLASVGVMILGGIALGVGILVAMPVVWLAGVHVYRQLLKS